MLCVGGWAQFDGVNASGVAGPPDEQIPPAYNLEDQVAELQMKRGQL